VFMVIRYNYVLRFMIRISYLWPSGNSRTGFIYADGIVIFFALKAKAREVLHYGGAVGFLDTLLSLNLHHEVKNILL